MILIENKAYNIEPYDSESEFEESVWKLRKSLFGSNRLYFNLKKKIGNQGKTRNIPDGYLIDLSSATNPKVSAINRRNYF